MCRGLRNASRIELLIVHYQKCVRVELVTSNSLGKRAPQRIGRRIYSTFL